MRSSVPVERVLPIFSDLHIREDNLEITIPIIAAMRAEALALGARQVGFLGDLMHIRGIMPVRLLNALVDELDAWALDGLSLILIPGNHDQIDVNGRNALEALRTHPAVQLYESPTLDPWGLWIPYRPDLDQVRELLQKLRGEVPAVFWHGSMLGALMNDFRAAERGLLEEDFAGYPIALLGHFHKRQSFGHVHYVGSPWETRADERGQPKGFAVLRGGRLEYQDRAWGPRHLSLDGDSPEEVIAALLEARREDVVKVSVPESQVEKVSRALAGRFRDFVVTPKRAEVKVREIRGAVSLRDHAVRLVEQRAGELDRDQLIRAFDALST